MELEKIEAELKKRIKEGVIASIRKPFDIDELTGLLKTNFHL